MRRRVVHLFAALAAIVVVAAAVGLYENFDTTRTANHHGLTSELPWRSWGNT